MRDAAREHVGDDLHLAMAVGAEAAAALDCVFVDDPQGAEAHELRIVVVGEGETEFGIEPAMVGVAAISGFTNCKHWVFLVFPVNFLMLAQANISKALVIKLGKYILDTQREKVHDILYGSA